MKISNKLQQQSVNHFLPVNTLILNRIDDNLSNHHFEIVSNDIYGDNIFNHGPYKCHQQQSSEQQSVNHDD